MEGAISTDPSGNYSLPSAAIVNGQLGDATPVQTNFDDLAAGMTERLCKNGKTTATANIPMGGFKLTGLGQGSAATDSVSKGQVDTATTPLLTGGGASNYTLTYATAPAALVNGMTHMVEFHVGNDFSATLNVNTLGAKPIHYYSAGAWRVLPPNLFDANWIAPVTYHASSDAYRLIGFDNRTGIVEEWSGSTAPVGTILANGAARSRTTYAGLFAVNGTTYGSGDGSTTFNVLDSSDRVTIGLDNSNANLIGNVLSGIDTSTLGATGGTQSKTPSLTGTTSGSLSVSASGTAADSTNDTNATGGGSNVSSGDHTHDVTVTGSTSGSLSASGTVSEFSIVQPAIVMNKVIRI